MIFDVLMEEIWKETNLPETAKYQLPERLSVETKEQIICSGLSSETIARIVESAVKKIDHGSVETIDSLINAEISAKRGE